MAYTAWSVVFGEQPSAAKWNLLGSNDAHFYSFLGDNLAWQDFTPSFVNWTIGTGGSAVTTAKYTQIGKTVILRITSFLGTSGQSVGSGVTFSLPVAAISGILGADGQFTMGFVQYEDAATATYNGYVRLSNLTTGQLVITNVSATYATVTGVSSTAPHVWGAGDSITILGVYEAA